MDGPTDLGAEDLAAKGLLSLLVAAFDSDFAGGLQGICIRQVNEHTILPALQRS